MRKMTVAALALPLVLALSACTTTTGTTQPVQPPIVEPPTPTIAPTPTPTPTGESGAYRTGEAVGETARDVWETTKEFGRGLWTGLQVDGEEGQ